ncbi:MAG: hypothetical protein AAGN82_00155 [Myxococcota bacterium]
MASASAHDDPYGIPPLCREQILEGTWHPEDGVPPGYRVATRANVPRLVAGAVTLGILWFLTVPTVLSASDETAALPALVPLAGPFIAIETTGARELDAYWLLLNGLGQVAGASLLASSVLAPDAVLDRIYDRKAPGVTTHVAPMVGPNRAGLMAGGRV